MSSTDVVIRDARGCDLGQIRALMNRTILGSTASWHCDIWPAEQVLAWWLDRTGNGFPVLVADLDGQCVGYATFSQFRPHAAYADTVEHSIYLLEEFSASGIGRQLMSALLSEAKNRGFRVMVGALSGDNERSIRFHEQLGFRQVGLLPGVGTKFGRTLDLVLVQYDLH